MLPLFLMLTPKRQIAVVRVLGIATGGAALTLAFGLTREFELFNTIIAIGSLLLAGVSFFQGYRSWAFGFLVATIVFNQFLEVASLKQNLWTILDIVLTIYIALFVVFTTNAFRKGAAFEHYVSTLFPEFRFTVVDRTRDLSKVTNRHVESDANPDFIFRDKKTNRVFAVECKYASRWWDRRGQPGFLLRNYQLENYRKFSTERNIPVYIAFGIGGIAQKPEEVYFVPLEKIKYEFVYQSVVRFGKIASEF